MYTHRLITVHNIDCDELPEDLRSALSPEDMKFLKQGPSYLLDSINLVTVGWLQDVLSQCGNCSDWHVQFNSHGEEDLVPYYRLEWGGHPAVCLPRWETPWDILPHSLQEFYTVLGGFQENRFDMGGGVMRMDDVHAIGSMGLWISDDNDVAPDESVAFLETLAGDFLCFYPSGGGGWYRHERGIIETVDDIDEEFGWYLQMLLSGKRL